MIDVGGRLVWTSVKLFGGLSVVVIGYRFRVRLNGK